MNQQRFIDSRQHAWERLEALLEEAPKGAEAEEFPPLYRAVTHDLALARERRYGLALITRLEALVRRAHQQFYRSRHHPWPRIRDYLLGGFARAVRRHWRFVAVAALCFYLPLLGMILLIQWQPELAFSVLDSETAREVEAMYDPAHRETVGRGPTRAADTDLAMFGYYIRNNTGIGFRTFATGLLFGVGTLFTLLFNAFFIGAVAGHLQAIGFGQTFWPFVVGHSAFELNAIVLSGAAGLMLGHALIAPGRLGRLHALRLQARKALDLLWG
ncbi:MAG: stage II sporulation protein M, partial [Gammaproteobacteria bacterium]